MPERLKVTPLEAAVILTNAVFGTGHYSQEVAKALHGRYWRRYYLEKDPFRPEDFLQDSQRSQLFIDAVDQALNGLSRRERIVVGLRFGLEDEELRTFREIGGQFGVTKERVRQIEAKSLRKLRHPSRSRFLKPLLPERS